MPTTHSKRFYISFDFQADNGLNEDQINKIAEDVLNVIKPVVRELDIEVKVNTVVHFYMPTARRPSPREELRAKAIEALVAIGMSPEDAAKAIRGA